MSGNLRLSGVKFQNAKSREITRQYEVFDIEFTLKSIFKANQGQSRSKITKKAKNVKFRTWVKVVKLYVKMKLLTSYFQKYLSQGQQGHPRSRITEKKVKFLTSSIVYKYLNRNWIPYVQKSNLLVRPPDVKLFEIKWRQFSKSQLYVKMNLRELLKIHSPEVNQGHKG